MVDAALEVARSIYRAPIDLIDPEGGLRPLDQNWVVGLAALMAKDGQDDPVEIWAKPNGRFGMTAGRHRLAAASLNGWTHIDAELKPVEELRREISENLFRLALSPMDRAAFVASLIGLEKEKAGLPADANVKSVVATARWADRIGAEADDASLTMRLAFGFTDEVAEKVGLSRQTIYRDLELHRGIRPAVAASIRDLPIAANASQLRALARLPESEQLAIAEVLASGVAKGVTDAQATMRQRPVKTPAQKAWSAITGSWGRLSDRDQKEMLKTLRLPKGVVVTIDGEPVGGAQ